MNTLKKAAFVLYVLVTLLSLVFALLYLFNPQFMSYHAVAVNKEWVQVDREFQVLILALMRTCGGGYLATALAMGIILFIPFRKQTSQSWPAWTLTLTGLGICVPSLIATLFVRSHTPAQPPWIAAGLAIVLLIAALILERVSFKNLSTGKK